MTEDTPTFQSDRTFLFKPYIPEKYLKEYYGLMAQEKTLYILILEDETTKVFILRNQKDEIGTCYAFWKKADAAIYANSCNLPKDKAKIWETSLPDLISFAKKTNKNTKLANPEDKGFDVVAGIFHENLLIDVDLIWSENIENMV